MTDTLLTGMAHREITPPTGALMAAFPVRRDPMQARVAEGVHDPLWARAWALSDGKITLVVCAADVAGFQWRDVDMMRAAFAERTGLAGEHLIVCGTHNHNGPECTYLFGGDPDDPYFGEMREGVVAAAADALSHMTPARVSAGAIEADLAYNRRKLLPDGDFRQMAQNPDRERILPVDPRVSVVRLDHEGGESLGAVLHFAAHPVILTTPNRLFTAEYPGAAIRHFEAKTCVSNLAFLQGACGDTHPYQACTDSYDAVEEVGESLAAAAAAAYEQASQEKGLSLTVERWTGSLAHRFATEHKVRVEIIAARLSSRLAMVFWQGEPFVELSLTAQWRSPFARTLVIGYSLGWVGYVPTRNAYDLGGYGVDICDTDPPEFSRTAVTPGTGEVFVDRAVELLGRLALTTPVHEPA